MSENNIKLPTPSANSISTSTGKGALSAEIPASAVVPRTFNNYKDGVMVGDVHGDMYAVTYAADIFRTCLPLGFVGRRDCYSVLICDYDDDNAFILRYSSPGTVFENKRTPQKFIEEFTPLQGDNLEAIKSVPALVMKPDKSENPSGIAMLGYITDIDTTSTLQMKFFLLTQIPVSALVPYFNELRIRHTDLWNELHEERWNIKAGDIFEILKQAGLNPPIL